MYSTTNQDGLLNNYAPETSIYFAEYPNQEQQRRYAFQGAVAILLVSLLVLTSLAASSIG